MAFSIKYPIHTFGRHEAGGEIVGHHCIAELWKDGKCIASALVQGFKDKETLDAMARDAFLAMRDAGVFKKVERTLPPTDYAPLAVEVDAE